MPQPYEVEQQAATNLDRVSDTQVRALVAAWGLAWSEVSADLVDMLTELLATGTRVSSATLRRSRRLRRALDGIAAELERLSQDAGTTISGDLSAVLDQADRVQDRLIRSQLAPGVRLTTAGAGSLPDREQLPAIVQRTSQQILSDLHPVAPEVEQLVRAELIRGVTVGTNPRVTARRMVDRAEDRWNLGLSRAMNVARTETLDAYREGARAGQQKHTKILAGWVWLAHLGPRTCRACLSMHGRFFPLDEAGPHGHQQCRCARMPVVKNANGNPKLDWVPDADKHFDALPEDQQIGLLGRAGYQAWKAGDFPRSEWAMRRDSDRWRSAWVVAPVTQRPRIKTPDGGFVDRHQSRHLHQHELDTADRLAKLGYDVTFIPSSNTESRPDVTIVGRPGMLVGYQADWEMKAIHGAGPQTVLNQLKRARDKPTTRTLLDLATTSLTPEEARDQVQTFFRRYAGVDTVWLLAKELEQSEILRRS